MLHLAHLVGGNVLLGLVSALAFATILAVVAGLAMSAVTAVSHDLYANVIRKVATAESQERSAGGTGHLANRWQLAAGSEEMRSDCANRGNVIEKAKIQIG